MHSALAADSLLETGASANKRGVCSWWQTFDASEVRFEVKRAELPPLLLRRRRASANQKSCVEKKAKSLRVRHLFRHKRGSWRWEEREAVSFLPLCK